MNYTGLLFKIMKYKRDGMSNQTIAVITDITLDELHEILKIHKNFEREVKI